MCYAENRMKPRPDPKPNLAFPIRFTPDDVRLLDRLQKKTGVQSRADIVRLALRALAQKEGV